MLGGIFTIVGVIIGLRSEHNRQIEILRLDRMPILAFKTYSVSLATLGDDQIFSIYKDGICTSGFPGDEPDKLYTGVAVSLANNNPAFNVHIRHAAIEDNFERTDYEKMDLYEESTHTMFAVKIGEASSNLCYAVDQSLTSLKMYKHGQPEDRQKQDKKYDMPKIERVGLWLIFFRSKHLPVSEDNRVNLSQIDMLMLKNRIDQWIKEVRLSGYIPVVYINYRKKEKAGKSK